MGYSHCLLLSNSGDGQESYGERKQKPPCKKRRFLFSDKMCKISNMNIADIQKELGIYIRPEKVNDLQRFFKTGKGHYAEGDKFLGVVVPDTRKVARVFKDAPFDILEKLIASPFHEERMLGLLILTEQAKRANEKELKKITEFYLKNRKGINNWDLVDVTAPKIVGKYLYEKEKLDKKATDILYTYARSKNLWEKRIAILSTFYFIREKDFTHALAIALILKNDPHDLIQKAVGWMLREVGNRNLAIEEAFLREHYKTLPRTTLRYATEKFPEKKRLAYLKGEI
jgi:3-methyladenine DNA glycosylase AlkD